MKKLAFAPIFLIVLSLALFQLEPLIKSSSAIFSFDSNNLFSLMSFSILILGSSWLFIIFVSLAQDWKIIPAVAVVAALLSFIFLPNATGIVLAIGILISLILTYSLLSNSLKTYLNFQPAALLNPSVKLLSTLLILVISLSFYLTTNAEIAKNGFQVPDSLIDTALKIVSPQNIQDQTPQPPKPTQPTPQLTKEQIDLLRKNPDALKLYNLDPKLLDQLEAQLSTPTTVNKTTATNPPNSLIKALVKEQINSAIKPYLTWIPLILALLFYFSLSFFISIFSIFIPLLIWLIFYLLEKTKFITFTTETREVKKMVV